MRSVSVQIIAVKTGSLTGLFALFCALTPLSVQAQDSAPIPVLPLREVLSEHDLRRFEFPPRALANGTSGIALAECSANPSGEVSDCTIIEEAPTGNAFGAETLRLLGRARLPQIDEAHGLRKFRVVIPFHLQGSRVPKLKTQID